MTLLELHLLVVFESRRQFSEILSEGMVLKGQLIHVLAVSLDVIDYCLIPKEQVKLSLKAVIFFVDKVNLSVQLLHDFFVVLLEVLH